MRVVLYSVEALGGISQKCVYLEAVTEGCEVLDQPVILFIAIPLIQF